MILGFLFPKRYYFIILSGMLWELLEYITQHTNLKFMDHIRGLSLCKGSLSDGKKHWWYAKWTDLVMNLLGFMTGAKISRCLC